MAKRGLVGELVVSTKMIWVGDPSYVMGDSAEDWARDRKKFLRRARGKTIVPFTNPGGGFTFGVCFRTPENGPYPVYAEVDADGKVKRVIIEFG